MNPKNEWERTVRRDVYLLWQLADVHLEAVLDVIESAGIAFIRHKRDGQAFGAKPARPGHLEQQRGREESNLNEQRSYNLLSVNHVLDSHICMINKKSYAVCFSHVFVSEREREKDLLCAGKCQSLLACHN